MLKPIQKTDLEKILVWRNSPDVRKNMYTRHEISWEEHLEWFERLKSDPTRICLKFIHCGVDTGIVNFTEYLPEKGNAFWGFYAKPDAAVGTGVLIEFDALIYAFETLGLHKLNCEVLGVNREVINLHKKTGFMEEGSFRDFHRYDEEYIDVVRLGMLDSEWPAAKDRLKKRLIQLQAV